MLSLDIKNEMQKRKRIPALHIVPSNVRLLIDNGPDCETLSHTGYCFTSCGVPSFQWDYSQSNVLGVSKGIKIWPYVICTKSPAHGLAWPTQEQIACAFLLLGNKSPGKGGGGRRRRDHHPNQCLHQYMGQARHTEVTNLCSPYGWWRVPIPVCAEQPQIGSVQRHNTPGCSPAGAYHSTTHLLHRGCAYTRV